MDHIEKLLRKISIKDRQKLAEILNKLVDNNLEGLDLKKIVNSNFYRIRIGKYRIIFHYTGDEVVVDAISLRHENTYKKFK